MINLLPQDYKEDQQFGRRNTKVLGWMTTLLFGIAVLGLVTLVGRLTILTAKNQASEQKTTIEAQLSESNTAKVESEYNDYVSGLGNVKKLYQQQVLYSRLIRKLATVLPPGAKLANISLTDADRAINLNFANEVDGLGPVIKYNLDNQGDLVATRTRNLTPQAFGIPIAGELIDANNPIPGISVNNQDKSIEFYINANEDSQAFTNYSQALKSSGEYAVSLVRQDLSAKGFLDTLEKEADYNAPALGGRPQITAYTVDTSSKFVNFTVQAANISEARTIEATIRNNPNSIFIDSYVFADRSYLSSEKCTSRSPEQSCADTCNDIGECSYIPDRCQALSTNGCRYIVRAYYDELYSTASIEKVAESESCAKSTNPLVKCSHKVKASFSPLFNQVDINNVGVCVRPENGPINCAVEMRAEFSESAKFYLINATGASK